MKMINIIRYRLHRYFFSSRPVIPLVAVLCFLGVMYSMRPMNVCSGYILSGCFQFVLLAFAALNMNGNEEIVEEELLLFHGKSWGSYCMAREITLLVISFFYGGLLSVGPVIVNCFNHFSYFTRSLTAADVVMGTVIIFVSGVAGIAIGDVFHPRIMSNRRLSVLITVALIVLAIVKDALIEKYRVFTFFGALLPPVMKPARDMGNSDFFQVKSVITFLLMMILYCLGVAALKNFILSRKKFS